MKIYIMIFLAIAITGCSTSQNIEVPSKILLDGDTRFIVQRDSKSFGSLVNYTIMDNDKIIGTLGSGGKLIWDRDQSDLVLTAISTFGKDIISSPIQGIKKNHGYRYELFNKEGYFYFVNSAKYKERVSNIVLKNGFDSK
ncbi:hypothetical protein OAR97_04565 [Arcobacteraceae bacterium]|nr:hypothetical protein [Arcobacteraceae bacterium]